MTPNQLTTKLQEHLTDLFDRESYLLRNKMGFQEDPYGHYQREIMKNRETQAVLKETIKFIEGAKLYGGLVGTGKSGLMRQHLLSNKE